MFTAIAELFSSLAFGEIVLLVVIIAVCIKEIVNFVGWCKTKLNQYSAAQVAEQTEASNIEIRFHKDEELLNQTREQLKDQQTTLNILSDTLVLMQQIERNSLKAWLTEQHHKFTKKRWIDDYSLDCIELRYADYLELDGNSFIEDLMLEVRQLPHEPPQKQ